MFGGGKETIDYPLFRFVVSFHRSSPLILPSLQVVCASTTVQDVFTTARFSLWAIMYRWNRGGKGGLGYKKRVYQDFLFVARFFALPTLVFLCIPKNQVSTLLYVKFKRIRMSSWLTETVLVTWSTDCLSKQKVRRSRRLVTLSGFAKFDWIDLVCQVGQYGLQVIYSCRSYFVAWHSRSIRLKSVKFLRVVRATAM